MSIQISTNFDLNAQLPLDNRVVKSTLVERDAIIDIDRYEGLSVYVVETGLNYQLVGGVLDANWVDITTESVPADNILDWNGTAYAPYLSHTAAPGPAVVERLL